MNSIRETTRDSPDPTLQELIAEAAANIRARRGEPAPAPEPPPLPKRIYDGPKYDGKQCAVCQKHFKSSADYVVCRLCKNFVCRRKDECKRLHHAEHRLAARNAQQESGQS